MIKTKRIIYQINSNYFEDINTHEKAYWLGFIMADGYNSGNFIRIEIRDIGHLDKLRDLIYPNKDRPIVERIMGDKPSYYLTITNKDIVKSLLELGVTKNKSKTLEFPNIKEEYYNSFILGIFDGDGTINYSIEKKSKSYRRYVFAIVGSKPLIASIHGIINSLDVNCIFREMKMIFECYTRGNRQIETILHWLYKDSTVFLDRKNRTFNELITYNKGRKIRKS